MFKCILQIIHDFYISNVIIVINFVLFKIVLLPLFLSMWYKTPINLVYVVSFVDLFAIGLTMPLLGTHLRNLGASHTLIGVLFSIYAGIQVVSGPVVGGWTDLKGRKSVLKQILFLCGICYGLLGFTESLTVIVILRIILGVVKHIQSICKAVISDILPSQKHAEAFGKSAAISSLGFIVGPLIGGQITELPNGFTYICCFTMILFWMNIVAVSYLPDVKQKKDDSPSRNLVNTENGVLNQIKFELKKTMIDLKSIDWTVHWEAFTLRFLFGLVMTTFFGSQSVLLNERYQLSPKYTGYVISYFSMIGTCSAFFIDKINMFYRSNDSLTKLFHYFCLMASCVIAVYVSPNIYIYLCILIPFSISSTALRIISMELIIQRTNGEHRGSLSGASNSVMSVSRFLSPLITGVGGDMLGQDSVILVAVVPALVGVFLCLHLRVSQGNSRS